MFTKKKKEFPAGTFIPTPQRTLAIIQLCLIFTLASLLGGYPFMGELFAIKSKSALYTYVMGSPEYASLPQQKQSEIKAAYDTLQEQTSRPFLSKMGDSIRILFFDISPFALAWMVFALAISLMILLKVEGARRAAWLLPVIAAAYGIDNMMNGTALPERADSVLFPSESVIVDNYLREPLDGDIFKQRDQLMRGWNLYLVKEWAKETPSADTQEMTKQVEKGTFAFTLARAEKIRDNEETTPYSGMRQKEALLLLLLYVGWNLYFAWMMNRRQKTSIAL